METEPLPWRTRMSYALTRARTIERQADGLRRALARLARLARLASAEAGAADEVERAIGAIREQLHLAEQLAKELAGRHPVRGIVIAAVDDLGKE